MSECKISSLTLIEKLKNSLERRSPSFLIIGDTIVDRSFILATDRQRVSRSSAQFYKKKQVLLGVGGALAVARSISMFGSPSYIHLAPGRGELRSYLESILTDGGPMSPKQYLLHDSNQSVNEVTRLRSIDYRGNWNEFAAIYSEEKEPVSRTVVSGAVQHVEQHEPVDVIILVDHGRGMLSDDLLKKLIGKIPESTKLIVRTSENWWKYRDLHVHSLVARTDHFDAGLRDVPGDGTLTVGLERGARLLCHLDQCTNLVVKDYSDAESHLYHRTSFGSDTSDVIQFKKFGIETKATRGGGMVFLVYYSVSIAAGLSETEAVALGHLASSAYSQDETEETPSLDRLALHSKSIDSIKYESRGQESFSRGTGVVTSLIARSGRICLADAQSPIKGILTVIPEYLDQMRIFISLAKEPIPAVGDPVRTFLILGDSGCGKGFFANKFLSMVENVTGRECKRIVMCNEFGTVPTGSVQHASKLLEFFQECNGGVLFLDETDKFQGSVTDCQSLFLEPLNSGKIESNDLDVFVVAATSSNIMRDIDISVQLPDFYRRFPHRLKVPSVSERSRDMPYLFGNLFLENGVQGIEAGALAALIDLEYSSMQEFISMGKTILSTLSGRSTIKITDLPIQVAKIVSTGGPDQQLIHLSK